MIVLKSFRKVLLAIVCQIRAFMQMAPLTSTDDVTMLLEQAFDFDLADSRLLALAGQIRLLAEACNDHEALFQATWLLGQHHLSKHEHALALEVLESLLDGSVALSVECRADLLLALTDASNGTDEIDKVLKYGNEALAFFRERQNVSEQNVSEQNVLEQNVSEQNVLKQVRLHGFLGLALTSLCSFHESLEHHMLALKLCESFGQVRETASALINIGWTYSQMTEHAKATGYLTRALRIAESLGDDLLNIRALGNLGNVAGEVADHLLALEHYRRAAEISERVGHTKFLTTAYGNMGVSFAALADLDQAMTFFGKALNLLERIPNRSYEGWLQIHIGKALLNSDSIAARTHLELGLHHLELVGFLEGVAETHLLLSGLYETVDLLKALEHHKAFAALQIRLLKDLNEKHTQALMVQFEVARLERERQTDLQKNTELARANERLEELSLRDALTGLHNRRHLDAQLAIMHLEAQATGQPFAVLISDIDDFKQVNDSFSHLIGDEVLKTVAGLFRDNFWGKDLVARFGGEEFVAVLRKTTLEQALMVAEKLRINIEAYPWHELHPDLRITVSIGLCADTTLEYYEQMLAVADDKMYVAKRNGKNQVQA